MIRTVRTASLVAVLACAACRGNITMHVEWHREAIPTTVITSRTDLFVAADADGRRTAEAFTHYTDTDDGTPILYADTPIDKYYQGKALHVTATYLDGSGLVLCEGEGDATADDGQTIVITFSQTGRR